MTPVEVVRIYQGILRAFFSLANRAGMDLSASTAAQIGIVPFEHFRESKEMFHALDGGRASPLGKRRRSGLRGLIEFGGRGQRDLRYPPTGREVADIQVLRRLGRESLTAHEILHLCAI